MRLMQLNYSVAVLPAILLSYYIPLLAAYFWPTASGQKSWLLIWQMHPILTTITLYLFSRIVPSAYDEDRVHAPRRDLLVIRFSMMLLVIGAAGFWLWGRWSSLSSVTRGFPPVAFPFAQGSFAACVCEWDTLSAFASSFLWLGYLFWDLKYAGMMQESWVTVVIYGLGASVALGPGAAIGLGWLWRENTLAYKRHKDAVTEDNLAQTR